MNQNNVKSVLSMLNTVYYTTFIQSNLRTTRFHPSRNNCCFDDLQYTIEYPSHDGSFPYMDILIHADKSTSVYRKPTHTNLYVRYNSCAPLPPKTVSSDRLQDELTTYAPPNTYIKNWTKSTQPPYKMDTPLTESNASWTVSNKN